MSTSAVPTSAPRARRDPAVVASGRNTKVRSRVRSQWLVLAAALSSTWPWSKTTFRLARPADQPPPWVVGSCLPVGAGANACAALDPPWPGRFLR